MTFAQLPADQTWTPHPMTIEMSTAQAIGLAQGIIDTLKQAQP